MKFNSIRFKLSILHTAVLGVILVFFTVILYFISDAFYKQFDQQLETKAEILDITISSYLNAMGDVSDALPKAVEKAIAMKSEGILPTKVKKISEDWVRRAQSMNFNKDFILVFDRNKKDVISSKNMTPTLKGLFLEDFRLSKSIAPSLRTIKSNHKTIRMITYPLGGKPTGEYFIQIGTSQDPLIQLLYSSLSSIVISFPLILLLTSYLGRKQASRILDPVRQITEIANKITHQDLSSRIKAKHFDSDMKLLVSSFNEMIARLEKSFHHIEEFSHHVAHELKTPLTIIKGEADLLLRKERSKYEYQQTLKIILEESERVLRTIDDLLLMSKLEYQPEVFKFDVFNFMDFFNEICEQARMLAVKKSVAITLKTEEVKAPILLKGDSLHLRRLFFNVINNAVRFSPEGGMVTITIKPQGRMVHVIVTDEGPGISPENLRVIFEKYSNASTVLGDGIGLYIAQTIAKIHEGSIRVDSKVGFGSTFTVVLPKT